MTEEQANDNLPPQRRKHRRVTSNSVFSGEEPRLLESDSARWSEKKETEDLSDRAARDRWLKEQRPPHHDL